MAGRTPSVERVAPEQATRLACFLRDKRESLGLSRDALGRATGLSVSTIRAIERGMTSEPGFFTVMLIATALKVAPKDLQTHAVS